MLGCGSVGRTISSLGSLVLCGKVLDEAIWDDSCANA